MSQNGAGASQNGSGQLIELDRVSQIFSTRLGPLHAVNDVSLTIEAGQVFTIEPGIYFIDTLLEELRGSPEAKTVDWKKIDALRPYGGIRIEDNVVVKEKGVRNLTREAFT